MIFLVHVTVDVVSLFTCVRKTRSFLVTKLMLLWIACSQKLCTQMISRPAILPALPFKMQMYMLYVRF